MREFEFYNEERDTWFTLSFKDLLKCAKYDLINHDPDRVAGEDNNSHIERVYHNIQASSSLSSRVSLGVGLEARNTPMTHEEQPLLTDSMSLLADSTYPLRLGIGNYLDPNSNIIVAPFPFDMGIPHTLPNVTTLHREWKTNVTMMKDKFKDTILSPSYALSLTVYPRVTPQSARNLYQDMKGISLNHPFKYNVKCIPQTPEWFTAFSFYTAVYNRYGFPMNYIEDDQTDPIIDHVNLATDTVEHLTKLKMRSTLPPRGKIDITTQLLSMHGGIGSVNNHFSILLPDRHRFWASNSVIAAPMMKTMYLESRPIVHMAKSIILVWELLTPLVTEYLVDGSIKTGIEIILNEAKSRGIPLQFTAMINAYYTGAAAPTHTGILNSNITNFYGNVRAMINHHLAGKNPANDSITPAQYMAMNNINTWPMDISTTSHFGHPNNTVYSAFYREHEALLKDSYGHMSIPIVQEMARSANFPHGWKEQPYTIPTTIPTGNRAEYTHFWSFIKTRMFEDVSLRYQNICPMFANYLSFFTSHVLERSFAPIQISQGDLDARSVGDVVSYVADNGLDHLHIDINTFYQMERAPPPIIEQKPAPRIEDVEIVIVRPNIEHCMLGIIMGLSGNELGNTLWGQTELSVYDDSMHGIW